MTHALYSNVNYSFIENTLLESTFKYVAAVLLFNY